jgi:hypothetical protein
VIGALRRSTLDAEDRRRKFAVIPVIAMQQTGLFR